MKEIVIKLSINKIVDMLQDRLEEDFDKGIIPKNSKEVLKKIVLRNIGVISRSGKEIVMRVIGEGYGDRLDKDINKFYIEIQNEENKLEAELERYKKEKNEKSLYLKLKNKYENKKEQ